MNRYRKWFVIVVLLVLVILVASIVILQRRQSSTQITPQPTITPIVQYSPTPVTFPLSLTLHRGTTQTVPTTTITITLLDHSIPSTSCADCVAMTTVQAAKDGQTQLLNYSCGGIAGGCIADQTAFGYHFHLQDSSSPDTITLQVSLP